MLTTILATILVLGVLIFVHELGHFWAAKLADIEVPRFSIGLGPKMLGFRRGETEYVISWLPLGGYVRMAGMEELESIEGGQLERQSVPVADLGLLGEEEGPEHRPSSRDFESKSVPVRAAVIAAGVTMNLIFAFVAYSAEALAWGVAEVPDARIASVTAETLPQGAESLASLPAGAEVESVGGKEVSDWQDLQFTIAAASAGPTELRLADGSSVRLELAEDPDARAALLRSIRPVFELEPVLGVVGRGQPADVAGLRPGDRVLSVAGSPIRTWEDMVSIVQSSPVTPLSFVVQRDGQTHALTVTPERRAGAGGAVIGQIGVQSVVPIERPGPVGALVHGAQQTWYWLAFTVEFLVDLITGQASPRNVGGPILIGQLSGDVARAGIQALVGFMALLSINLAVFNLLPIPVLDGGQLVFLAIEGVRGRALSLEQRLRLTQVGLVFLVGLMVWVIANDLLRLFGL
ncbi:MAG: RIP metalloprotease RseP [Longimicrobiales bacterium]